MDFSIHPLQAQTSELDDGMKTVLATLMLMVAPGMVLAACTGTYQGFFEKQPLTGGDFTPVQTFTINPSSGQIEQCENDNKFQGDFSEDGDKMQFGYARRMRELTRISEGTFLSATWQAEFNGVKSVYRIRVETK